MKIVATEKAEQNQAALDPWTAVHFGSGLAMGLMDLPLGSSLALAVAYEAAEQAFERREWGRALFVTAGPESISNAMVDMAALALGHWLGRLWNRTG